MFLVQAVLLSKQLAAEGRQTVYIISNTIKKLLQFNEVLEYMPQKCTLLSWNFNMLFFVYFCYNIVLSKIWSCSWEHYFFLQYTLFLAKYLTTHSQIVFHTLPPMLKLSVDATHMKCGVSVTDTLQLIKFQVMLFQTYEIFKKKKKKK